MMDITEIRDEMQRCSASTEQVFTKLGEAFPSLLTIGDETGSTSSLPGLEGLLASLTDGFSSGRQDEMAFFREYDARNSALFDSLNERMSALDRIHERVTAIRTDSEELELISLNAMVISIKSGEKGRAFSCITENLKRLSAQMISLSNNLMRAERKLLDRNDDFKKSFLSVTTAHDGASTKGDAAADVVILPILASATDSLTDMKRAAALIKAPIREAMAGIQLQDIIRQSIDQIILALKEISPSGHAMSVEESLDHVSVNCELLEISSKIASDIEKNLENSIGVFTSNWSEVHRILDEVEGLRSSFLSMYLDSRSEGGKSLPKILGRIMESFTSYIGKITAYQRGQKSMVANSDSIVTEVKALKALFETIRPIISRLQHVRITQQIEVAKNAAISSVKDTVMHMSDLIVQADIGIQDTRKELETFIAGIEELTRTFTDDARRDSRELERIKQDKLSFFQRMQGYQDNLASSLAHLQVYPDSFQELCGEVDRLLDELRKDRNSVAKHAASFQASMKEYQRERDRLYTVAAIDHWDIRNDRLRELVERFTITAHKEVAGKIGGFDVEGAGLESVESGDVTLFF